MSHTHTRTLTAGIRRLTAQISVTLVLTVLILAALSTVGASITGPAQAQQEISTWHDLDNVSQNLSGDYVLINDLDESTPGYEAVAGDSANAGSGFAPIGSPTSLTGSDPQFDGTFDGQGHNISSLYINNNSGNIGLFGKIASSGVVSNVSLWDVNVTGEAQTGGLFGWNEGTVRRTSVTGVVNGNITLPIARVGGLGGRNDGMVSQSFADATVNASAVEVGGLLGLVWNNGTVRDSYAQGDVIGVQDVGGLVGIVAPDTTGLVENSYATGNVSGTDNVGGLVGALSTFGGNGTVTNSYWDIGTTNQASGIGQDNGTSSNLVGYGAITDTTPAAEMLGSAATTNMTALDFGGTWDVLCESAYPVLEHNRQIHPTCIQDLNVTLSDFDIAGQGTAATIAARSTHPVSVTLTNLDSLTAPFPLTVVVSNGTNTVISRTVTTSYIAPGSSKVVTFENITGTLNIAAGAYNVSVETANATTTGSVTVRPDVNGDGTPAVDTTGDGNLDDIDGDGSSTILDVQALFAALHDPVVQDHPALFEFAGSGTDRVSIFDVQALYAEVGSL